MTQKYEREIEEILRNLDEFVPEEPWYHRAARRVGGLRGRLPVLSLGSWRRYLTVQWLMVASISLMMLGFLLRMVSGQLAWYANLLGIVLFVAALAMSVFHFGRPGYKKRWRGQVVDISSYNSSWWESIQRRWRVWRRSQRW